MNIETQTAICQVCGGSLTTRVVLCPTCETPHHADCWEYLGGGCSTYGCPGARKAGAVARVMHPAARPDQAPRSPWAQVPSQIVEAIGPRPDDTVMRLPGEWLRPLAFVAQLAPAPFIVPLPTLPELSVSALRTHVARIFSRRAPLEIAALLGRLYRGITVALAESFGLAGISLATLPLKSDVWLVRREPDEVLLVIPAAGDGRTRKLWLQWRLPLGGGEPLTTLALSSRYCSQSMFGRFERRLSLDLLSRSGFPATGGRSEHESQVGDSVAVPKDGEPREEFLAMLTMMRERGRALAGVLGLQFREDYRLPAATGSETGTASR